MKSDYVVDYTRLNIDQRVLMEHEVGGYDYRYVYGLDKLQVKVTGEGSDWWGQSVKQTDCLGSITNLTDEFGRVTARSDYGDWGEVRAYESITVDGGFRMLMPEVTFAGHEYDDVLNQFYAKYRFYDADLKRFDSVDPIKGFVTDPLSLVQYLYVQDNPIIAVDPLGLIAYEMLNAIGWGLAHRVMSNQFAFLAVMINSGVSMVENGQWTPGHQLAQAFAYKWMVQKLGYPEVELEFQLYNSGDRIDTVGMKGNTITLFEIKHRTQFSNPNYIHAEEVLTSAKEQLKDYYKNFGYILDTEDYNLL